LLRYKGTAGDTAAYKMSLAGTTTVFHGERRSSSHMGSEVFLTQKVDRVREDGVMELTMSVDSGQASVDGREQALPVAGRTTRTELSPTGETKGSAEAASGIDLAQLQLVFPEQPLEIGTAWSRVAPASQAVPVALETTYRIVGFERVGDLECARIVSQVRATGAPTRPGVEVDMKADGSILFAHQQGFMVDNRVHAEMSMAFLRQPKEGAPERVVMKTKLEAHMAWQYQADRGQGEE
jgi:hypothetical protein